MMQRIALIFFWLSVTIVHGQNSFSLSGKVLNIQSNPVSIGDVLLLLETDSTLLKYTSVVNGMFSIEDIPEGKYLLKISCLGFEEEILIIELNKNLSLEFQLSESTTNLDEVEVVAAKPIVSNSNGNLKIDVTNPVFSSIPDAVDLISRFPNLQVSPNRESITVLGKGSPLIYVGNQQISLEEFKGLTVDDIASIEIVRNPSAKYEANGRAVLLITRKASETEGYKLNLTETLSWRRNFNNYANLNGSFTKGKLTVKGNLAYNYLLQWEGHQFEFAIPEADILSNYAILVDKNDRVEINAGGGLSYQINETDYFSASTTFRSQSNDAGIDTDTFLQRFGEEDNIISKSDNENTKSFISSNINFNKKLSAKINMFAGLQHSSYVQDLNTEIANNFNLNGFNISEQRRQRYRINVFAYRLDFDKTFEGGLKWEIGANVGNAKANALTAIEFLETDMGLNVDYDYRENTTATYTTLSGNLSKKINFNAGIRVEKNIVKGENQIEEIPLVDRRNTNLFPRANLSITIDSTKKLAFNYTKSIDRPNYSNASSIQVFFNPFLEGEGNVNLLPTVTEELSTVFQFAKNSISVEYFKRRDPIYYTIGYKTGDDRAVFSLKNLEKESGWNINLTVPITKGKWTATNTISLSTNRIQDVSANSKRANPYLYVFTDHQFKVGKKVTVSFGGWGLTKRSEGIFERNAMLILNATITKTFFERLNCSLRFNDITRSMNFEESYDINGVIADGVYFVDAQEIAFSLKYTFGKSKDPSYKNKDVDEHLDRIR